MEIAREIAGKVALVTGAGRGIGRALVEALIEAGAAKVYAATRGAPIAGTDRIAPLTLDVTDPAAVARAAEIAADVDLLVNNAGVAVGGGPLGAPTLDGARREMETNYFGVLAMSRAFAPALARRPGSAIVNLASILSHAPLPQVGTYAASKAAVLSLTQALRAELRPSGVHVMAVLPAFVDTDMARGVSLPKLSTEALAAEILRGLRAGEEDLYPGPAAALSQPFRDGLKAMERQFAQALASSGA